jgi:ketosteroid isomerase-like protein
LGGFSVADERGDLEARVGRLEDLAAINQLFIDYGAYLDAHDFAAYAGLFAADAEVLLGPLGRAKGPEAIKALMERTMGGSSPGGSFHVISNPVVRLDGDRAEAQVMWTVIARDAAGQPYVSMMGHHKDQLVRGEGRWFFQRRAGYVDIPTAYPVDR